MTYLDNAATSFPKPPQVAHAMIEAVQKYGGNPGRSGHQLSMKAAKEVYNCRCCVAQLFDAQCENVIFTNNATQALNIALLGSLSAGCRVIISDVEHNALLRPLISLRNIGVGIDIAQTDPDDDDKTLEAFANAIKPNTKMIAVTTCSNVLGCCLPINAIGALAKKYGLIFIVDASQSAGVYEYSLRGDNIDILCAPGHKSLYGPQGSGVMVLSGKVLPKPLLFGGTGVNSADEDMPSLPPERYEAGTLNTPAIVGLHEGILNINLRGIKNIARHECRLAQFTCSELKKMEGVQLYTNARDEKNSGIVSFNVEGKTSEQVAQYLNRNDIMVRGGLHCAPMAHKKMGTLSSGGAVRVSYGMYNSYKNAEKLIDLIKKIL